MMGHMCKNYSELILIHSLDSFESYDSPKFFIGDLNKNN